MITKFPTGLRVFSCLITNLMLFLASFLKNLAFPIPLSFHRFRKILPFHRIRNLPLHFLQLLRMMNCFHLVVTGLFDPLITRLFTPLIIGLFAALSLGTFLPPCTPLSSPPLEIGHALRKVRQFAMEMEATMLQIIFLFYSSNYLKESQNFDVVEMQTTPLK